MLGYAEVTSEILRENPVIVNCTPCGMFPHTDECPSLPYEALGSDNVLFDLIYNPDETKFLSYGKARGAKTKNGLEMLHLQALASWEFWNLED
jgi:shikimate dehydrogenase